MADEIKGVDVPYLNKDGQRVPTASAEEIGKLKSLTEEYLNGWKRAKADYLNLKKDMEKQLAQSSQFAAAATILELLPIADHFKLALDHIPEDEKQKEWVKGILHIHKEFNDMLKRFGIEMIETEGKEFNPELHEAVSREKKEGVKPHTILKELTPGYKLFDKVLQHAKVHVAE